MDPERARKLLAEERNRIQRLLERRAHSDSGESEDDSAALGTDLYQDEFDEGLADDLREDLAAVERAEARLAAGTYGLSVESGDPIPDERLEALPTAERTAEEEAVP
jgi:DnaK suppressor protein